MWWGAGVGEWDGNVGVDDAVDVVVGTGECDAVAVDVAVRDRDADLERVGVAVSEGVVEGSGDGDTRVPGRPHSQWSNGHVFPYS